MHKLLKMWSVTWAKISNNMQRFTLKLMTKQNAKLLNRPWLELHKCKLQKIVKNPTPCAEICKYANHRIISTCGTFKNMPRMIFAKYTINAAMACVWIAKMIVAHQTELYFPLHSFQAPSEITCKHTNKHYMHSILVLLLLLQQQQQQHGNLLTGEFCQARLDPRGVL